MKRIFYKAVTKAAGAFGLRRLEAWSYVKWLRLWMNENPETGYWRFVEDYLGKRIPWTPDGKIEI